MGPSSRGLNHLATGRHVALATGTSSGKSLVFQAAGLAAIQQGRRGHSLEGHRLPTVLYIAPTKALAADQWRRLAPLDVAAAAVDGDNSREEREWARNHASWILTNPDTLHHVLLPRHERWTRVLGGLRYVVVDEAHHYRGVFGAHVALVLRRLRRVCAAYGSSPQFVLASATMSDPAGVAGRLTGLDVVAVADDASPRASRRVMLWQPPLIGETDARRSVTAEAADLLADLVVEGTRTLAFVRSRRGAELVAGATQRLLADVDPALPARVATYRGGYLPEERRELEARLRSGDLLGLATTNALELGIDISGLDAVVSVGFPGTRAGAGAAVRPSRPVAGSVPPARRTEALGVFIARDEPLDAYLVNHPSALLDAPLETTVFDTDNPYVLGPHLAAAAHERPLTEADADIFGPRTLEGIAALEQAGWLRKRAAGWFWTRRDRASDLADLRSSGGRPVQIVDSATGRLIGTVDASSADATVHDGAVYVHQGESWVCDRYDVEAGVAEMHAESPEYWTTGPLDDRDHCCGNGRNTGLGRRDHQPRDCRRRQPGHRIHAPGPGRTVTRRRAAQPAGTHPSDVGGLVDRAHRCAPRRPHASRRSRRSARGGARLHRHASALGHLRPVGPRWRVNRTASRHGAAHRLRA